jgi:hypothetical protein
LGFAIRFGMKNAEAELRRKMGGDLAPNFLSRRMFKVAIAERMRNT